MAQHVPIIVLIVAAITYTVILRIEVLVIELEDKKSGYSFLHSTFTKIRLDFFVYF
jgi:hypothetical protein